MLPRLNDRIRGLGRGTGFSDSNLLVGAIVGVAVGCALIAAGAIAGNISPADDAGSRPKKPTPAPITNQAPSIGGKPYPSQASATPTEPPRPPATTVAATSAATSQGQSANTVAKAEPFNGGNAMVTVREFGDLGSRRAGSEGERRAAEYVVAQLEDMGYETRVTEFRLPGGGESRNVVATAKGSSDRKIVLAAHLDGAGDAGNDNASGCAAVLEIARILAKQPVVPTVEFAFFGSGAPVKSGSTRGHMGSRVYVRELSDAQRGKVAGMISLDCIGTGDVFMVRTMGIAGLGMRNRVLDAAIHRGEGMGCGKDEHSEGSSDHEAFEKASIPAAWITWESDGDAGSIEQPLVRKTGQFVLEVLREMDQAALDKLSVR